MLAWASNFIIFMTTDIKIPQVGTFFWANLVESRRGDHRTGCGPGRRRLSLSWCSESRKRIVQSMSFGTTVRRPAPSIIVKRLSYPSVHRIGGLTIKILHSERGLVPIFCLWFRICWRKLRRYFLGRKTPTNYLFFRPRQNCYHRLWKFPRSRFILPGLLLLNSQINR